MGNIWIGWGVEESFANNDAGKETLRLFAKRLRELSKHGEVFGWGEKI